MLLQCIYWLKARYVQQNMICFKNVMLLKLSKINSGQCLAPSLALTIDLDLPLSLPQGLLLPPFVTTQQQQEVILGGSMDSNIPEALSVATIMAWTECQVWVACQCLDIALVLMLSWSCPEKNWFPVSSFWGWVDGRVLSLGLVGKSWNGLAHPPHRWQNPWM